MALDSWSIDISGDPLDIKAHIAALAASSDPVLQVPNRVSNRVSADIDALGALLPNTGIHVSASRHQSPGFVSEGYEVRLITLLV